VGDTVGVADGTALGCGVLLPGKYVGSQVGAAVGAEDGPAVGAGVVLPGR